MQKGMFRCIKNEKSAAPATGSDQKDTYRIKEEITIPGTKESIGQILFTDISERKLELRPGQDELIVRGELFLFCMYLSGDEKPDWISQTIPYEGRIPCEGISEEMYFLFAIRWRIH